MTISMNYILSACIVLVIIIAVIIAIIANGRKDVTVVRQDYRTIWDVVNMIKTYFVEMLSADISEDVDDEEFDKLYRRIAKIRLANKNATFGMDAAKALIKDLIGEQITRELLDSEIDSILGLGPGQTPSVHVMFESVMQLYKVRFGKSALSRWLDTYKLAEERMSDGHQRYFITSEDVYNSYMAEHIEFNKKEKVKLLSTLVYQLYRGFGIIDTIREMNLDGINIGTSGSILSNLEGSMVKTDSLKAEEEAVRGCWLYYHGRYIHLRFMNFGTSAEIQRIVNLLIRYNSSGTLTAKRGYIVSTMYDKSRLLAMRPPVAEHWAAFIRKFTLSSITVDALICKENVTNAEFTRDWLIHLMHGLVTSLITGRQGSGKTTLMSAMIEYVDPKYNIRVLELAPELYLRELYKNRNILSAQETQHVSAVEIQNAFKKSDSAMSVCGEISSDDLAARFFEFGRVASIMNLATHHANTTEDGVQALGNSISAVTHCSTEAAERQVIDIVKIDIHLDYTKEGFRYIERITEVVPVSNDPYEEFTPHKPKREDFDSTENGLKEYELALLDYEVQLKEYEQRLNREYYTRRTDAKHFKCVNLLHFDIDTMTYIADNPPSQALVTKMKKNMTSAQQNELDTFLLEHYSVSNLEDINIDSLDIEQNSHVQPVRSTNVYNVEGTSDTDLDSADALLSELNSRSQQEIEQDAMIDMTEAIAATRAKYGTPDELDNLTIDELKMEDLLENPTDTLDKLVGIGDVEEDVKIMSEQYAPTTQEELSSMFEKERQGESTPSADVLVEFGESEEESSHGTENKPDSLENLSDSLNNFEELSDNKSESSNLGTTIVDDMTGLEELDGITLEDDTDKEAEQQVQEDVNNMFDTLYGTITGEPKPEEEQPVEEEQPKKSKWPFNKKKK